MNQSDRTFHYKVKNLSGAGRLDIVLTNSGLDFSRRKIRRLIDVGAVYLNKKRVRIASKPVKNGDLITIEYSQSSLDTIKSKVFTLKDRDILFFNEEMIAINKPPGLNSHPTRNQAVSHAGTCLVEWLKKNSHPVKQLQLVHRLDKETSGVLLFARTKDKATWLMELFRERTIEKYYEAICIGSPYKKEFEVKCRLSNIDRNMGTVKIVSHGGKESFTRFKVISENKEKHISWISCFPKTGRSHQLRVHLASKDLPIAGDKKYGSKQRRPLNDQLSSHLGEHHMLHAKSLKFHPGPGETEVEIQAEYPFHFKAIIDQFLRE